MPRAYDERRMLWEVLSALRGPDSNDMGLKDATTAVIRHKVFGDSLKLVGAITHPDCARSHSARKRALGDHGFDHFVVHARQAFGVLGLDWRELNAPSDPGPCGAKIEEAKAEGVIPL